MMRWTLLAGAATLALIGTARAEQINYGPPAAGGGSAPCNSFGTAAGTCAQGNDSRIVGALQIGTFTTVQQLAVGITTIPTITNAGAGTNNAGDVLTLNDGCTGTVNGVVQAHAKLNVATVTGGPPGTVATVTINTAGVCVTPPVNPVTVSSSTGSDTTPTFTVAAAGWTGVFTPTRSPVLVTACGAGSGGGGVSAVNGAAGAPGMAGTWGSFLWFPTLNSPATYRLGIPTVGGAAGGANNSAAGGGTVIGGVTFSGGAAVLGSSSGAAAVASPAGLSAQNLVLIPSATQTIIASVISIAGPGVSTNGSRGMGSPWGAGGNAGAAANGGNATGYCAGGGGPASTGSGEAGGNGAGGALTVAY